jgi:hypothetical protein
MAPNDGERKAGRFRTQSVVLDPLCFLRWTGESYSDLILRLAAEG